MALFKVLTDLKCTISGCYITRGQGQNDGGHNKISLSLFIKVSGLKII